MDQFLLRRLKKKTEEECRFLNGHWPAGRESFQEEKVSVGPARPVRMQRRARFCQLPRAFREYAVLSYTCNGHIWHRIAGTDILTERGGILLIRPGEGYGIRKLREDDICVEFCIWPEFLKGILALDGVPEGTGGFFKKMLLDQSDVGPYLQFSVAGERQAENLLENLILLLIESHLTDYAMVRLSMGLLFLYFSRSPQMQFAKEEKGVRGYTMLDVIQYVEQNYKEPSLSELADRLGVASTSLSRFIRRESSRTFRELVLEKRFRAAEDLLLHSDVPGNRISLLVGYENGSHFYQKFQERYHMTPKEYRKKYRKKDEEEEREHKMHLEHKMRSYWDRRAESYSGQNLAQISARYEKWRDVAFQYLPGKKGLKALDVGTGPGFLAILLAREGYLVDAVDKSGDMLAHARENARQEGVDIQFHHTEGAFPFPEESFDVIVSRDVVWIQMEPEKELAYWYSLLKKGGTLLYFDAAWYSYLQEAGTMKEYKEFRRFVKSRGGFVYPGAYELEQMVYDCPLVYQERPKWDMEFWKRMGAGEVLCETGLNTKIYSEMEQLQYAKDPELLICVWKVGGGG